MNPPSVVLAALFFLAPFFAPSIAAAQTSTDTSKESSQERAKEAAEARKREAAQKRTREAEERRQREATQRERQASERRERERWERQEILRRQDAMRAADEERAADRARQNAEWDREMQRQRQAAINGARPAAPPGPYSIPGTQNPPPRSYTSGAAASADAFCSATPYCPAAGGGNVCIGVKHIYAGAGAAQTGLRDIVSRCQSANAPDPCNTDARLTYGGCAQQCAKVARCSATDRR